MMEIESGELPQLRPRIAVIGVGGAGANAVETMIAAGLWGVDFIVANTDAQALNASTAEQRIQLGRIATQGLGAGSNPAVGTTAARESVGEVCQALDGAHMCFIAAGMGGGTGTGASSVIAAAARAQGVLTVGVVTLPFSFEGRRRTSIALEGLAELEKHVDTLIIVPNQNIFRVASAETTFKQAFKLADAVLEQGVRGITDLMMTPGVVNLDFADIRSIMGDMGRAMMTSGEASGANRAIEAAEMAIFNPLLDGEMRGAKGLIISISGGEDVRLMEIDAAAGHIRDMVDPEADIIWGSSIDPTLEGRMRISIVATGLEVHARLDRAALADIPPQSLPKTEPAPSRPEPVGAARTAFIKTFAESTLLPAGTQPTDDIQVCTNDLLAMFLPEVSQSLYVDEVAPAVPAAAPPAEMGLFHRMAMLARGGARAELEVERLPEDLKLGGSTYYDRRAGGGRR